MGKIFAFLIFTSLLLACQNSKHNTANENGESLLLYVGAASKPPVEEIVEMYQKEKGTNVDIIFGGSGYVLSQMKLSGKGDIFFPGSSDFMEIAKRENLVFPETEKEVVYLVNAINVQKGNPKNIQSLKDLSRPGLKIAIANPESVCVGTYAVEIIEQNLNETQQQQFRKNLVNYTESCDKTAAVIALRSVDAVIGWSVFEHWNPEMIETVTLAQEEIVRIGYIPVAIAKTTKNQELAQDFIDFVTGPKGKAVFQKYNYFSTSEEAAEFIGADKPVGGEYALSKAWLNGN